MSREVVVSGPIVNGHSLIKLKEFQISDKILKKTREAQKSLNKSLKA